MDYGSLRRLVDFYIGHGVTGITVLGMMGEANEMTCQEPRDVIDTVVGRAGDLPVVVGISDDG